MDGVYPSMPTVGSSFRSGFSGISQPWIAAYRSSKNEGFPSLHLVCAFSCIADFDALSPIVAPSPISEKRFLPAPTTECA